MTGMGSRLLKSWLLQPKRDRTRGRSSASNAIAVRCDRDAGPWHTLREQLKGSTDVERITARIALRQVRPRELVALRVTLQKTELLAPCPRWD